MKNTKHALLMSGLALLLCVSMLVGSTYAWFTDSVTSTGNIIKSGKLEVTMEWKDAAANGSVTTFTDASAGPIFNYDKWEPGYVEAKNIKIENVGTLAFKYQISIIANGQVSDLADVIDVYYADGEIPLADRSMTGLTNLGTLANVLADMDTSAEGNLAAGANHTVTLALKMRENAGNQYQEKSIGTDFSVQLLATQLNYESDSFDNEYDKDSSFPLGESMQTVTQYTTPDGLEITAEVKVPEDAPEGDYALESSNFEFATENGVTAMSFELDLMRTFDGQTAPVTDSGVAYPVVLTLPHPFLEITEVWHNGERIVDFTHDRVNNTISFTTNHFSPFSIVYKDYTDTSYELDYDMAEDGSITITKGLFVNANPALFDASLASSESDYIVVSYEKNGATNYVVSERATSVFVSADETASYGAFNEQNVTFKKAQSGKLYLVMQSLKPNDHNTVYLLPGTYNEATTIGVFSSMDIIGLGDGVNVVKAYSEGSNQHLFNCTNSAKADYIQVTLRNLHLDASEYNYKSGSKRDNAAVQSIRKTKVKCYDLTVVKSTTDSMQCAFYVNANNEHDDKTVYDAYMYVENCALTVRGSGQVVSVKNGSKTKAYFYHSGLTYNNTAYTTNTTYNKNVTMAADDWSW